jgi:hypothetical protein
MDRYLWSNTGGTPLTATHYPHLFRNITRLVLTPNVARPRPFAAPSPSVARSVGERGRRTDGCRTIGSGG